MSSLALCQLMPLTLEGAHKRAALQDPAEVKAKLGLLQKLVSLYILLMKVAQFAIRVKAQSLLMLLQIQAKHGISQRN